MRKECSGAEMGDLTDAVVAIHAWSRMAIAAQAVAGQYQPAGRTASATT